MKYLHYPEELAQTPIRLNKEELQEPRLVIKEFFSSYTLNDARLQLGNWLELAFAAEDEDMKSGIKRVNLLQFSYQLEAMLEAVFILKFKFDTLLA
jgi:hypothetical protein